MDLSFMAYLDFSAADGWSLMVAVRKDRSA
jgi:hypothetical protein